MVCSASDRRSRRCRSAENPKTGKKKFIPLSNEEKTLISAFVGDEDHVMKMSEGIIEGDQIRVLKGPLQGYEALVAKVDRHKRLAYIDLNILG